MDKPTKKSKTPSREVEFEEFEDGADHTEHEDLDEMHNLDLVKNVAMEVSVELGRTSMPLGKILQLTRGSIFDLKKPVTEPLDILVNGKKIGRGIVVVTNDQFAIRVTEILDPGGKLAGGFND
jgi:flagellar motor switch protein FliN/FliY